MSTTNNSNINLELDDIQGFILRGYKRMRHAVYLMVEFTNTGEVKSWLEKASSDVTNTEEHPTDNCFNIAITYPGFVALGLREDNLDNFSLEFRTGMNSAHRSRLLGDLGESSPDKWIWGNTDTDKIHMMVLLFGADQERMDAYYHKRKAEIESSGMKILHELTGQTLPNNKEHFGFRDGISQPVVIGSGRPGHQNNMVQPGEFILGYTNEYGVYPESPLIQDTQGDVNLLPEDANRSGMKDLGRNGSYLVFRQIEQYVEKFWSFMFEKANQDKEQAVFLAAKMTGRWPSGAPLVKYPEKDPGGISDDDDFGYHREDKEGMKCPFGSHLRRSNPRDDFEGSGTGMSLKITKRHRIIRRARLYGDPIAGSPDNFKPNGEVGLHFIAFQSDIGKQFEFIQHTWCNYPNFMNLYDDPDPLIGTMDTPLPGYQQRFTIQAEPAPKVIHGLVPFTRIRGGAYFFFPGITAIRYLASL